MSMAARYEHNKEPKMKKGDEKIQILVVLSPIISSNWLLDWLSLYVAIAY